MNPRSMPLTSGRAGRPDRDWEIEGEITEDYQRVKLSLETSGAAVGCRRRSRWLARLRIRDRN